MQPKDQALDVWGEFACFTNPVMKVERFSYPVITPSAARGIYDAIYCKPKEFRWQVTRIEVLKLPSYIALRRNEVKDKAPSDRTIAGWMGGKEPEPIWADGDRDLLGTDMKGRTQRQTMALKCVKYRLHAEIRPWPGFEGQLEAFENQFRRRAEHGKCAYQPYFGCREFPAYFELVPVDAPPPTELVTTYSGDLGWMLYDVFDLSKPGPSVEQQYEDGSAEPSISLFDAKVTNGVLAVPPYESEAVHKGMGRES